MLGSAFCCYDTSGKELMNSRSVELLSMGFPLLARNLDVAMICLQNMSNGLNTAESRKGTISCCPSCDARDIQVVLALRIGVFLQKISDFGLQ
jgi:hypothetical protein